VRLLVSENKLILFLKNLYNIFKKNDEKSSILIGSFLLGLELFFLIFLFLFKSTWALKLISMIVANHLGGRLAFIGIGLEFNISPALIILIIIFYNTAYLMIFCSFLGIIKKKTQKIADKIKKFKKWNWITLSLFVWLPFHMTGAVSGLIIARLEGYETKESLLIVLPSMWLGVICWTLWFEDLYKILESLGPQHTIIFTFFLISFPFLYYLLKRILRNIKSLISEA